MKFMMLCLMGILPLMLGAQSQTGAASGVPGIAIPKTTAVLVIETPKQGVTPQQIMAVIPDEIQATVRLYLDGRIREWYSRGDRKGVIFLADAKTESEARALMETLPLAKEQLMDHEYIPVGPLMPLKALNPGALQKFSCDSAATERDHFLEGNDHDQAQNHRDWRNREDRQRCC